MIKGQNFRLLINGKCIAGAKSCIFEDITEFEEITTKDDVGSGKTYSPSKKTYNISVDSLVINKTESGGIDLTSFIGLAIQGSPFSLQCTETTGNQNRTPMSNPNVNLNGYGLINDLSIKAQTTGEISISAKIMGVYNLTKTYN